MIDRVFTATVLSGPPLFGVTMGMIASHYWLGLSVWTTVTISTVTAVATTVPVWVLFRRDMIELDRSIEEQESKDRVALGLWQDRHSDPVFGVPGFGSSVPIRGWCHAHLGSFSGFVSVVPKERLPYESRWIQVHITPEGFTEFQRKFYLRLIHDLPDVMKQIQSAINSAFHCEFPHRGDFPPNPALCGAKIGRYTNGQFEDTELIFEYEQDEYVCVVFTGERVVSVEFYA